ncbi:hypothetical protein [Meridianimarinicoccus aquatilis]|uniref:Dihydrodipicolinate reductase n=1 Tax=Meridianimarinicoccus aquatilis TaxID=2552766 RepID=A0A4V3BBN0_9RHOB|nr:hypothetical protein [Fluviibacterium aquatile]QIE41888.1 hypothetical protein G5B39_07910 [Rhodobacteraceae bacterium SC52]TDL87779.1 hypothetical protein E2L05_10580 [Fluviibacterium aquatile]
MTRLVSFLGLALLQTSATFAQTPMSADEFEQFVTGRTLTYGTAAGAYGIEEYGSSRQVRWSFLDEECIEGIWYPQDGAICFAYVGRFDEQCWHFFLEGGQLSAITIDAPDAQPHYVIEDSDGPMQCFGPRIGV